MMGQTYLVDSRQLAALLDLYNREMMECFPGVKQRKGEGGRIQTVR